MQFERRGAAVVGWLIGVAALLRLLPLARLHPIAWDEIEYFRATDWVARGLVPYRDFWEHHSPLQWFVFAPVAAMTSSPGVSAILAMRWAQLPLLVATFVLLAKWMRREGASELAARMAVLLAICSTLFTLGAIEYRVDVLGCALYVAGLFFGGWAGGAALCLAAFANVRLGPLIVVTILLSRTRWRAMAGAAAAFVACSIYFVATSSAAIAVRRVWTENYLADKLSVEPSMPLLRRLAAPFGFVGGGFDPAAVDAGTIVIFLAGLAGLFLKRDRTAILQIANIAFVASMKAVYHYHFMIVILLALPFVAAVVERLPRRAVAAIVAVAIAVSAFASVFRGKEADLDYQDFVMREIHRRTPPGARVFDGVGWAIRREPAYRYWFLAQNVRTLEARGVFEPYDIAARPPDAVVLSIPTRAWLGGHREQAEFVRRNYRPVLRELWLPIRLAQPMPQPMPIPVLPDDVTLDAAAPPRTHWPRLW